jgi:tRNA threonylcarbamoyl adenosine modification protein YeaZ
LNILIFDTATVLETVILSTGTGVFSSYAKREAGHSSALFGAMQKLLSDAGIRISDIDAIAAGIGPGSFTGIRTAVSTARALAQVLAVPIVGIKTHDMYAASVPAEEGARILVAFDAKKNRVFGALYAFNEGAPRALVPPGDYLPGELHQSAKSCACSAHPAAKLYAVGDGAVHCAQFGEAFVNSLYIEDFRLDGRKISDMVIKELEGKSPLSYNSVLPFYARKPNATRP